MAANKWIELECVEQAMHGSDDDLSQLAHLENDTILRTLKRRYEEDNIYTCCGDILIALNPCKEIPQLFSEDKHKEYDWKNFVENPRPHVFHTAATAFRRMREFKTDQVIIVCGESGAGKTESTKYMVKHFVHMSKSNNRDLHEKIIKVNPLLEAFGNAKTKMNHNSSRFAKYLELGFKKNGDLVGVLIRDYMLEKSRVVTRCENEGNFHIFYSLFHGTPKQTLKELHLEKPIEEYRILEGDRDILDNKTKYSNMYKEQLEILQQINTDPKVMQNMLAALIHLTEIRFIKSCAKSDATDLEDLEPVVYASELLGLNPEEVISALISTKITAQGEEVTKNKNIKEAEVGRDALAKALYEKMFQWIVRQINTDLYPGKERSRDDQNIGILDIAGFEKLATNSFEQLCINTVNERLQNFMNAKVFKTELTIYKEEGIDVEEITFRNNDALIDFLMKQSQSVLSILDEQSTIKHGTDDSFVSQLNANHKRSEFYTQSKLNQSEFTIKHFAGQVSYTANGLIEKNRDLLNKELKECMKDSSDEFISDLFTVKRGPTGTISATQYDYRQSRKVQPGTKVLPPWNHKSQQASDLRRTIQKINQQGTSGMQGMQTITSSKEHKTLVSFFKESLKQLLKKIELAEHLFVRCLKPNAFLNPEEFKDHIVSDQLRYNGVSEIAKIRKTGFTHRKNYTDFVERYGDVWLDLGRKDVDCKKATVKILGCFHEEYKRDYQLGNTMVFMKDRLVAWMEGEKWRKEEEEKDRKRQEQERERKQKEKEERKNNAEKEEKERKEAEEKLLKGMTMKKENNSMKTEHEKDVNIPESPPDSPVESESPGTSTEVEDEEDRPLTPPISIDVNWKEGSIDASRRKKTKRKKFWDIFKIISRDRKGRDVHEQLNLQVLKVVTYIVIFGIVLFCAVAQKISLITLMTKQTTQQDLLPLEEKEKDALVEIARYWLAVIAICIPYGLTFISSLFKWIFGNLPAIRWTTLLFCLFMEGVHAGGIALFVFRILPELDMVRAILLLNAVGIIPSMISLICSSVVKRKKPTKCPSENCADNTSIMSSTICSSTVKKKKPTKHTCTKYVKKIARLAFDALSFIAQITVIPVIILLEYFSGDNANKLDDYPARKAEVAFTVFMVSFSMWENFVDDRFCGSLGDRNVLKNFMLSLKFDLQESRPKITFFTSFIKVAIILGAVYVIHLDVNLRENRDFMQSAWRAFDQLYNLPMPMKSSALILTVTTFVGYYAAYTACKLNLQICSFSIPLLISSPLACVLAYFDCPSDNGRILGRFSSENRFCGQNGNDGWSVVPYWWHIVLGVVWRGSIYWIGRHIWFPTQERLSKVERLFTTPFYCSVFFEENLVLNRRRHNRKVIRESRRGDKSKIKVCYRMREYDTNGIADDSGDDDKQKAQVRIPPMIYACATLWHEEEHEMLQLLKSLFRMDKDQFLKRVSERLSGKQHRDYYDYQAHIFFDDAMELTDDQESVPNEYVKRFVGKVEEAASSVYEQHTKIDSPIRIPTPYGGQLVWLMPGDNLLFLHMKDKNKIRHKKRWSQVMYIYYLLGFRLVRQCEEVVFEDADDNFRKSNVFQALSEEVVQKAENTFLLALDGDVDFTPGAVRLMLDRMKKKRKDGSGVWKNSPDWNREINGDSKQGPLVWYQKFEYATAHWLQKATEHVLGCVLCSPGCFSLFRGSALMDNNVMRKYASMATGAVQHLMYDLGEDRWLCTLLLQQGYRVDYAAASDAYTFAPEGFEEYFNQRRRWTPSTVANIVDLLTDYKNTIYVNSNISMLYILYQFALLVSSLIGPATVLMMISGAFLLVFGLTVVQAYLISLAPAILYFSVCFFLKPKWQILVAEILTGMYAFIMMIVLVGTIVTAIKEGIFHPSVIFLTFLVSIYIIAALLHPKEWFNIVFGLLYFLLIPSGYLLLIIYSLVNLNIITWGTREVPKKKTQKELADEKTEEERKKKEKAEKPGFFARLFPSAQIRDIFETFRKITEGQKETEERKLVDVIKSLDENIARLAAKNTDEHMEQKEMTPKTPDLQSESHNTVPIFPGEDSDLIQHDDPDYYQTRRIRGEKRPVKGIMRGKETGVSFQERKEKRVTIDENITSQLRDSGKTETKDIDNRVRSEKRDEMVNPAWLEDKGVGEGDVMKMAKYERKFWEDFIKQYLKPLCKDVQAEQKMEKSLVELRNNVSLGVAMINLLWMAINFMFQLRGGLTIDLSYSSFAKDNSLDEEAVTNVYVAKVDILGLLFVFVFAFILILQIIGMIMHRWGTFQHFIAITQLGNPFEKKKQSEIEREMTAEDVVKGCKKLLAEPLLDYESDDEEKDKKDEQRKKTVKEQLLNIQTVGTQHPLGKSRNQGSSIRATLRGSARFDPSAARNNVSKLQQSLSKSLNMILGENYKETENDKAPEEEELLREMKIANENLYRLREGPLPDSKRVFVDLRGAQSSTWRRIKNQRNLEESQRSETDSDTSIYDEIPGTMGRALGKKLKLLHKVAKKKET